MKLAFLYAGQGSQRPGMGADFYEDFPAARDIYDNISCDFDIKELSFQGGPQLDQTSYTQPCMVTFAAAVTKVLYDAEIVPAFAAGLSLGEYSALLCAGVFDPQEAVSLVRFRGQAMEEAAKGIDSAMIAVLNLDRKSLEEACERAACAGLCQIANYNCPGQLVIGGEKAAVELAATFAKQAGAKRCIPLNVSGPFHTPLLRKAGDLLEEKFRTTSFAPMQLPVIFNATARPLADHTSVAQMLVRQVQSPVLFEDSIRYLAAQGVDTIVEIGPGKVLSGFVRKTCPELKTFSIDTSQTLASTLEELKGAC